jgi:hypothetical protein
MEWAPYCGQSDDLGNIAKGLIGRLPSDLYLLIPNYLPIPDFPSYSRTCRAIASLSHHENVWKARWLALGVERHELATILDQLEAESTRLVAANRESAPPTLTVEELEDDFNLVSSSISTHFGEFPAEPSSSHKFRSPGSPSQGVCVR